MIFMGSNWNDFKKQVPWKDMIFGFLIPKGILFLGISLNMLFPGAILAALWCLGVSATAYMKERKLNIFALFALAMIFLRVVVILASKSPALYLLAQALDSALYGLIFLISLLFPRPLIQVLAEASGVIVPEAIRKTPYYEKAWRITTGVWGLVFIFLALILAVLKMGSLKSVVVVDMLASWPPTIALIAFTVLFPKWYWKRTVGDIPA
jgi:intracellular septation protein A